MFHGNEWIGEWQIISFNIRHAYKWAAYKKSQVFHGNVKAKVEKGSLAAAPFIHIDNFTLLNMSSQWLFVMIRIIACHIHAYIINLVSWKHVKSFYMTALVLN